MQDFLKFYTSAFNALNFEFQIFKLNITAKPIRDFLSIFQY